MNFSIKKRGTAMTTETKTTKAEKGISRRSLLKTGAAAVGDTVALSWALEDAVLLGRSSA